MPNSRRCPRSKPIIALRRGGKGEWRSIQVILLCIYAALNSELGPRCRGADAYEAGIGDSEMRRIAKPAVVEAMNMS